MFHRKTVIVVGAGASAELNLPTGFKLRNQIAELINIKFGNCGRELSTGDAQIVEALRHQVRSLDGREGDINPYLHEGRKIASAMPQALSIDNFLEAHDDNTKLVLCGKLAIARAILHSERESKIYIDHRESETIDFSKTENTWIAKFFQIATEGVSKSRVQNIFDNIAIISFNYDRCIRHYIRNALKNYYVMGDEEADILASKLVIYHPYGSIGCLPWQDHATGIAFGASNLGGRLVDVAKSIKTFSERIDDTDYLYTMKFDMQQAERILYIGYAFHNQNQNLMTLRLPSQASEIFATVYGISSRDQTIVARNIRRQLAFGGKAVEPNLIDATAVEFLSQIWLTLSN